MLDQTYVLLFGVHIRDLLDKSFCRVTFTFSCDNEFCSAYPMKFAIYVYGLLNGIKFGVVAN